MEVLEHFMLKTVQQVAMGEPFLVNLNFYNNVYKVVTHLQTHGHRAWYDVRGVANTQVHTQKKKYASACHFLIT